MDVYAFLRDPIVGTFGSLTPRDRGDEGLLLPWAEVGLCFRGLGDLSIFESLMASLASPSNSGGTGYTRIVSPYMGSLGLLVGRTDPSRRGEPGDRTGLVPREPGDRTGLVPREPGDRTGLVLRGTDLGTATERGTDLGTATERGTDLGTATERGTDLGTTTERGTDLGTATERGTDLGTATERVRDLGTATERGTDLGVATERGTDLGVATERARDLGVATDLGEVKRMADLGEGIAFGEGE